mgnify:CR=1 FL=1
MWRVIALDEIKDFDTLKYEAVLMSLELQYSRRRLKEQAEEIARLKGHKPAEQLELELVKKNEQLARLRHKVFGDSSERRPGPNPPSDEKPAAAARGHGPTPQPRLPKREEHHRLADVERRCPACQGVTGRGIGSSPGRPSGS